jgi:hypothetical protein
LFTWLADDDVLLCDYNSLIAEMVKHSNVALTHSKAVYVNEQQKPLAITHLARFGFALLDWGPNLIPQPSCIFRTKNLKDIGGINTQLSYAFDQDIYSRLKRNNEFKYLPIISAQYRFHKTTLTSLHRWSSLRESHRVRLQGRKSLAKCLLFLLFPLTAGVVLLSNIILKIRAAQIT